MLFVFIFITKIALFCIGEIYLIGGYTVIKNNAALRNQIRSKEG